MLTPGSSDGACWTMATKNCRSVSEHVVEVESLPAIHKDPFDRLLVAQATVEGITLLTLDSVVAQYPGPFESCNQRARIAPRPQSNISVNASIARLARANWQLTTGNWHCT